jgi:quinolinate synthase
MKLTTLGWLAHSLENMVYRIEVQGDVMIKAKKALDRMLAVSGEKPLTAAAGY